MTTIRRQITRRYWSRLSVFSRTCCVLLPLLFMVFIQSHLFYAGRTSQSGRDTFISGNGRLIWKHRSAPHADFASSAHIRGLVVFGTGMYLVQTTNGQRMYYFTAFTSLLVLLVAIAPAVSIYRIRLASRRGFPVSLPSQSSKNQ